MKPFLAQACSGWVKRHHFGRVNMTCLELRACGVAGALCAVCELELRAVLRLEHQVAS